MTPPEEGRVLVVEDDPETREVVARALREDGFSVEAQARAASGTRAMQKGGVSAVILDVWLPDGSGIDMCRAWRSRGLDVPILMLTARTDVGSRVAGLEAGADDYLGKPFALAELRARLRALLRRGPRSSRERVLRRGDVVVDFARRQAFAAETEVPLTRREIEVLERLFRGGGHAVARDDLLDEIWGEASDAAAASLEVILARLRRKLERDRKGVLIRTVRGFGYALAGDGGEEPE
jgi:two-component system, OmpR family, response regulator